MAVMEMRMLLCWVLRRFRFSKVPGVDYKEWEGKIQDWFVVHQEPLVVSVSLRENDSRTHKRSVIYPTQPW